MQSVPVAEGGVDVDVAQGHQPFRQVIEGAPRFLEPFGEGIEDIS
jgi:hypothetical protein